MISISAGNHAQALAYGAARGGHRLRSSSCGRARARRRSPPRAATAPRSTSRRAEPAEAFERLDAAASSETGRTLVHPFDDPLVIAGQGTVGLEIARGRPGRRRRPRPGRRRRARLRHRDRGGAGRRARDRRRAGALARAARRARGRASPCRSSRLDRRRAQRRRSRARLRSRVCTALGVEVVLVTEDEIEEASASSTSARSSPASPPARPRRRRCSPEKSLERGPVVAVVSGGNVAPETAAAILAGDEGRTSIPSTFSTT